MPATRSATRKLNTPSIPVPVAEPSPPKRVRVAKVTKPQKSTVAVTSPIKNNSANSSATKTIGNPEVNINSRFLTPVNQRRGKKAAVVSTSAEVDNFPEVNTDSRLLTPVNQKRGKKAAVVSTSAEVDNFPDHLKWNSQYFGIPVTSTPIPAKQVLAITDKDIDTCFGFDDSDEENYDALISPIPGRQEGDFNALLARYRKTEKDDDGLKLHFNSAAKHKTYSHKKAHVHAPHLMPHTFKKPSGNKSTKKNKRGNANDAAIDSETKKWVDQKNKEFDDVLHVPLVVTKDK